MNPRSPWTIVAVVVVLAAIFFGYRIMSDRRAIKTTATPSTSTEQTGSTTPVAPATGTTTNTAKPPEGTQTGTKN